MKSISLEDKEYLKLPENAGIYIFKRGGDVLYVGKAKNLKSRVSSYFSKSLGSKTQAMLGSAEKLFFIPVDNEFEALLLEANLVKKYQPKYNVELRDDKSPLYIAITDEDFPRILSLRQTQLKKHELKYVFGPFVSANAVRQVMRKIRKAIPYASHKPGRRECVRYEIGLCDPCPTKSATIEQRETYNKNILKIKNILSGNSKKVLEQLKKEMNKYSKLQKFEKAQKLLKQIDSLEYLIAASDKNIKQYIKNPNLLEDIREEELFELKKYIQEFFEIDNLQRIECYDVAHIAGSYPTASMVTFIGGEADKSFYRQFKINQKKSNSDTDSIKEVLGRRLKHLGNWGEPDLIIIDGGKPQLNIARQTFKKTPVVGLAKRFETLVFLKDGKYYERKVKRGPALNLLQRMRDEAHRFARRYHHKLVSKSLIP